MASRGSYEEPGTTTHEASLRSKTTASGDRVSKPNTLRSCGD
ncbi:hypothetical protein [Microcoleus sp. FACHB-831]|nr:hypothetical protein [Microcoleus sp. FACHB-831]